MLRNIFRYLATFIVRVLYLSYFACYEYFNRLFQSFVAAKVICTLVLSQTRRDQSVTKQRARDRTCFGRSQTFPTQESKVIKSFRFCLLRIGNFCLANLITFKIFAISIARHSDQNRW